MLLVLRNAHRHRVQRLEQLQQLRPRHVRVGLPQVPAGQQLGGARARAGGVLAGGLHCAEEVQETRVGVLGGVEAPGCDPLAEGNRRRLVAVAGVRTQGGVSTQMRQQ